MRNNAVEIDGLCVSYGAHKVLDKINLEVKKGEFLSIVGKSGTGKTTLLNAIAGFVNYGGTIWASKEIGFLFQNYSLFPWMTIKENVCFGIENQKNKNEKVFELIKVVGLKGKETSFPAQLSGGQQQRASFARALAPNPKLLLLDEPFGSLDYYTKISMQEWLNQTLSRFGTTVILVTHDLDEAIFLSDRIAIAKNGKIEHLIEVPFEKPRMQKIKYSLKFQRIKRVLLEMIED